MLRVVCREPFVLGLGCLWLCALYSKKTTKAKNKSSSKEWMRKTARGKTEAIPGRVSREVRQGVEEKELR